MRASKQLTGECFKTVNDPINYPTADSSSLFNLKYIAKVRPFLTQKHAEISAMPLSLDI